MKGDFVKYLLWAICVTIWATMCFIVPDFVDYPIVNWRTVLSVVAYVLAIGTFQFFIIYTIGGNKYICALLLPLYALTGSICAYYRLFYHISISPIILEVALHTDVHEAAGVVSIWLVVWVLLNIIIGIVFGIMRFRKIKTAFSLWIWIISVSVMIGYYTAIPSLNKALQLRFPVNLAHSIIGYISLINRSAETRTYPNILSCETPDSLIVIAVIGESVRSDHMQLNGYPRATNPLLSKTANITCLPHIYSQYTHTNGSVPHIVTRADSVNTNLAYTEHSFISLFSGAGFQTIWLSSQHQTKPFWDFMQEADTTLYTPAALTQSIYSQWLDEELLPLVDTYIGQYQKQLLFLHTMGSHWSYEYHVSDEYRVFQPITTIHRDIRKNTKEQIINSYDNTIVYLDVFLYSIISRLQNYPAIVLYLSDHGESLGEGGRYLHAQDGAEEEKYPAAFVWYSDKYRALYPEKIDALHKNSQRRYRTDYFFYSILYAAGIEAEGDNPDVNIFKTATP